MRLGMSAAVQDDGVVGTLFEPSESPRGAALVLGGSDGGVDETVARALSEAGFVVLALAYFGVPGLPEQLSEIPVETAGRGLQWLRDQPSVAGHRVGLLGTSKGGELALLAASRFSDHIAAVVGFAASPVVWQAIPRDRGDRRQPPRSSWTSEGKPLPFVPYGRLGPRTILRFTTAAILRRPPVLRGIYESALNRDPDTVACATIPVEQIAAPLLLISGTADQLWPSTQLADLAMRRLAGHERPYRDEHLSYPGAGHLAGRPPPPGSRSRYALGGTAARDRASHDDAWPRIVELLAAQCSPNPRE